MGKHKARTPKSELLAQAPSVRKGEVFRATHRGLERLQINELRNGTKYNRKDELPYHRIASVSHEAKVSRRGSWILSGIGVLLLLAGFGIPGLSLVPVDSLHLAASRLSVLMGVSPLQNAAFTAVGLALLAGRYPRKISEEWWQVRGSGLSQEDYNGWQIAGKRRESEKLVEAVRAGISRTKNNSSDD